MPNMDGTGPRFVSKQNGFGRGRRFGNGKTATSHGFSRDPGRCCFAEADNEESLVITKAFLQSRLAEVEKLLQEN